MSKNNGQAPAEPAEELARLIAELSNNPSPEQILDKHRQEIHENFEKHKNLLFPPGDSEPPKETKPEQPGCRERLFGFWRR